MGNQSTYNLQEYMTLFGSKAVFLTYRVSFIQCIFTGCRGLKC